MMKYSAFFLFLSFFIVNFSHAQVIGNANAQSAFGDPIEQVATGGGGLSPVEGDLDAGSIPVGSTAQVITRFKNESGRPIEFQDIRLYPSSTVMATISVNECAAEPLDSGAECAVIVSVKGLQPGNWRVEMLVRHNGRSRLVTNRISGVVESNEENITISRDIEVSPSPVDFGDLTASRPIIRSLTIRNITSSTINISNMFIDAPNQSGYDLRADCDELASGQACIASILWSPIIEGPSSGFLVIQHDGASAVTNIPLSGEFSPGKAVQADIFPNSMPGRGVLVSSETEVDFGTNINAQSAITVSLVNVGDADLTLDTIQLAGSENGLKLLNNGCKSTMVLAPTEACPLTISWVPTKIGSVIDDVQIYHSGARGVLVLPVRGAASEAISIDSKPIIVMQDGVSGGSGSDGSGGVGNASSPSRNQPVLDGYIVTSHSKDHAIIRGPVGSRIVANGKTTLIGGFEWGVEVIDDGVRLTSGANIVLLVFDRSLSTMGSGSVASGSGGASN